MPETMDRCAALSSHNEHHPDTCGTVMKSKEVTATAEGLEPEGIGAKKGCGLLEQQVKIQMKEAAEAAISEKRFVDERKTELNPDGSNLDKANCKLQNSQKIQKSGTRQADRPAPTSGIMSSASTPTPMTIPGWPGGLSQFECNLLECHLFEELFLWMLMLPRQMLLLSCCHSHGQTVGQLISSLFV